MKISIFETIIYRGPNRHCERTVFEQTLHCDADDLAISNDNNAVVLDQLVSVLDQHGFLSEVECRQSLFHDIDIEAVTPFQLLIHCYPRIALLFQQAGNHHVDWQKAVFTADGLQATACYEYDDDMVGWEAGLLALCTLRSLPCLADKLQITLDRDDPSCAGSSLGGQIKAFLDLAQSRVLPDDTEMLIRLARERGIPCAKGDRYPFQAINSFRVRLNGGLRLGFGNKQHVLDGTLCLDQASKAIRLLDSNIESRHFLEKLNAPLPMRDPDSENCNSLLRASRSARKLGYPVSIKPGKRMNGLARRMVCSDRELETAVRELQQHSRQLLVERHSEGQKHHLIFANNKLVKVIVDTSEVDCGQAKTADRRQTLAPHQDYLRLGGRIAQELGTGLFAMTVAAPDLSKPLLEGRGVVVDLCVAPEIDRLTDDKEVRASILGEYMDWLYPPGRATRVPIVAITGTNGKTTTSRMINNILIEDGGITGLACTDGVYIAGQRIGQGDSSGYLFHHQVLQDTQISHAVLETARGAVLHTGFAYDQCDIAVCTNVTDDHLGEFGVNTLDEMAALKLSILKRATAGAVLNADDPYARSMFDELAVPRICLTSCTKPGSALDKWGKPHTEIIFGVVERREGTEWITLYEGSSVIPVVATDEIPATYSGTARHNVSNALQAAAACYLMGTPVRTIQRALTRFNASYDNAPGRLNVVQETPFRVIVDYAHNADGYRVLADFIDRQSCTGRKILLIGLPGRSSAESVRRIAENIAGHFDRYICRDSKKPQGFQPGELPELLKIELCILGVAPQAINIISDQEEALKYTLDEACPGDLVVLRLTSSFREQAYRIIENFE